MLRLSRSQEELLHLIEIRQIFHLAFTPNDLFYNSSESLLSKHIPRGGIVELDFILYRKMEKIIKLMPRAEREQSSLKTDMIFP